MFFSFYIKEKFVGPVKILHVINGWLIIELFLLFIRNTMLLIQNVIKRFRVRPKQKKGWQGYRKQTIISFGYTV